MTDHKKAAQVAGTGTASNTTRDSRNSTAQDPFQGWYALAKNAKTQPVKRYWTLGKQRGQIDGVLLAHVLFVIVAALLIGGLVG